MAHKLTRQDVAYVARLARLELSQEELEHYTDQLGAVLDHADALLALDLSDVPPTAHALALENVFRQDVVRDSLDRGEVLANAPASEDGKFKVPRILGEAP